MTLLVHLVISQTNYMSVPNFHRTGKGKHAMGLKGGEIDTLEKVLMINPMVFEKKGDKPNRSSIIFH